MKVLIVDDDRDILEYYKLKFEGHGIKDILLVESAKKALEVLNFRDDVFIVLSDICMPEMDGLSLCREVKAKWSSLPVILLSSKMTLTPTEALAIGADHFFSKHTSIEEKIVEIVSEELKKAKEIFGLSDDYQLQT